MMSTEQQIPRYDLELFDTQFGPQSQFDYDAETGSYCFWREVEPVLDQLRNEIAVLNARLADLEREGYDIGWREGWANGFDAGNEQGHQVGYNLGLTVGQDTANDRFEGTK